MLIDSVKHKIPPRTKEYSEFGGYSYIEIRNKLHISEVVSQINAVELKLNDILTCHYFSDQGLEYSEKQYLDYSENELFEMLIKKKCTKFIAILDLHDLRKKIAVETGVDIKDLLDDWRNTRNKFAHGAVIFNSSYVPIIYYKGRCYDIEKHTQIFFAIQEKLVKVFEFCINLYSPYYGKMRFADDNNTPDNPI